MAMSRDDIDFDSEVAEDDADGRKHDSAA
jgi:hypothetical protein